MGRSIGIIAIKGGVGKTTISSSLAVDLANHFGKKVLLVDGNFSAPNLGLHMDIVEPEKTIHHILSGKTHVRSAIQNKFGVDVIPGSYFHNKELNYFKLRDKLRGLKEDYDFTILDSSPALNNELLSTMLASDNLFVVSTPDYPTLSCSLRAASLAKNRGKPISGIILNKIRDPKYEISLKEIEQATGIPVVARISDDPDNIGALFTRIPMPLYRKNGRFSREINKLSSALTGQSEDIGFLRKMFLSSFRKEEVNRQLLKKELYSRTFE